MSELLKRITINDQVCNGKPTIRGMRITVQTVMEFILAGTSEEELLRQYPMLEPQDIEACKTFAIKMLDGSYTIKNTAA